MLRVQIVLFEPSCLVVPLWGAVQTILPLCICLFLAQGCVTGGQLLVTIALFWAKYKDNNCANLANKCATCAI